MLVCSSTVYSVDPPLAGFRYSLLRAFWSSGCVWGQVNTLYVDQSSSHIVLPREGIRQSGHTEERRRLRSFHKEESRGYSSRMRRQRIRESVRPGARDSLPSVDWRRINERCNLGMNFAYPSVDPTNQTRGMKEKARAMFVSSAISPTADFRTPMLPLRAPASARLTMMAKREWESPKEVMERASPRSPIIRTGLRPIRSERRPQWNMQIASVRKNKDSTSPT